MPFKNVTDIVLNEEMKEVQEICERNPEVAKAIRESDREYELRLQLIKARKAAGLTQKDIVEKTGLAQQAISRLETDNNTSPNVKSLIKYVEAIGYELTIQPKSIDKG